MNIQEMHEGFNLLYQNTLSSSAPGLDGYEVSVFLTKAQKELILDIYNNSFEINEESRRYLNHLIKTFETNAAVTHSGPLSKTSKFYELPDDVWFRLLEYVNYADVNLNCDGYSTMCQVTPTTHDEYHSIKKNPFRRANKNRVLRLDYSDRIVEIISAFNVMTYGLRYLKAPEPIIVEDLFGGLTIDGIDVQTECKLNDVFHEQIINRAVQLAKESWTGAAPSKV
jgi:hypothetical protein